MDSCLLVCQVAKDVTDEDDAEEEGRLGVVSCIKTPSLTFLISMDRS